MVPSGFALVTAPRPDTNLPIEAQGHLRLEAPTGRTVMLFAEGDVLRLELKGWSEAKSLAPRSGAARRQATRALARALSACGLTLHVEAAGSAVCQIGHGVRPNWIARLLRLAPARVPLSALGLSLRR